MTEEKMYNNESLKIKFLVEKSISFFCNLFCLSTKCIDFKFKEIIFQKKQKILEIIIDFTNIKSTKIYGMCLESIYKGTESEPRLFEILEKKNFLEKILSQKYDYSEKIKMNSVKILGNYIAVKNGLTHDFFVNVVKYNLDVLFSIDNTSFIIKEILWALSNIIHDDMKIALDIYDNQNFMCFLFHFFKGVTDYKEINDISAFMKLIIANLDQERFDLLLNSGIIEIITEQGKIMVEDNKNVYGVFEFFEQIIFLGEKFKNYYENNNVVVDKLEMLGMKEVFENNIGSKYETINKISENICDNYFEIKT